MLSSVFLFLFVAGPVQAEEYNVPLATVYMRAQDEIVAKLCHDSMCVISANAAYKTCYSDDLKKHKQSDVPAAEARSIGDSLYTCTAQAMKVKVGTQAELNQGYLGNYKVADVKPVATPPVDAIAQMPLPARYLLRVKTVVDDYSMIKDRIKAGDRSICPNYKGIDMSGCAASAVTASPIDTSTSPTLAMTIVVLAGVMDKSKLGPVAVNFMMSGVLTVAEHVNKQNFFLRRTQIQTEEDIAAQKKLINEDNQLMAVSFSKIVTMLGDKMYEVPKRTPASALANIPSRASLEARLKNLQRHPW